MENQRSKGQVTMYALIGTIITLVAFGAMYPLLDSTLTDIIAQVGADSATAVILNFLPVAISLGILAGFWYFVAPSRGA